LNAAISAPETPASFIMLAAASRRQAPSS